MNLSFSGCGFLGIYHLGVAKTLASDGKLFIQKVSRYGGASAGALIASLFAVYGADEEMVETCKQFCLDLAENIKSQKFGVFTPGVELLEPVQSFLEKQFPLDAHIRASGRLFVSITNAETKENEIVSDFPSREVLIKYLLASSCIPYITNSTSITIGDKKYCDGGLTNNLPSFHEGETICVSPFEGKHEICPSISLPPTSSSSAFSSSLSPLLTKIRSLSPRSLSPNRAPSSSSTSSSLLNSNDNINGDGGGDDDAANSCDKQNFSGTHFTVVNQNFKICLDNLTRGIHIFSPPSLDILANYYRQGMRDARNFLHQRGYMEEQKEEEEIDEKGSSNSSTLEKEDNKNEKNNPFNFFSISSLRNKFSMSKSISNDSYHDAHDVIMTSVESSVD